MRQRIALVTEIISPYRIPLFNSLAYQPEIDLHVIFLAETDPGLRQWHVYKNEIEFSYQVLPSWRRRIGSYNLLINHGATRALNTLAPHRIICGGYNHPAFWQCLLWAHSHQVPCLLWSESNLRDLRRGSFLVESLKKEFLSHCSGFLVPGQSAREYLRFHRVKDEQIFTTPNAVGNDLFICAAERARANPDELRKALMLPDRYFLFVGRLVPEKGVFDLLAAYAKLDDRLREQIGLVFVGEGSSRRALEVRAATISPGVIRFAGFVQREDLGNYYPLAEALILPTHSDPWGLVVNEAMACGLPIIVSDVAGCAPDLVKPAWNGFHVPPANVVALNAAMAKLAAQPGLREKMASNSREQISRYTPEVWAKSVAAAISAIRSSHE
jgi:1,2-diacylglycerol 3-alpha-glucosyltransferase